MEKRGKMWKVETLDFANPELYPGMYVAAKILIMYPVSTSVTERSFSSMKRLKRPLRCDTSDARLTSLSVIHVHEFEFLSLLGRKTEDKPCVCYGRKPL